MHSRHTVVTSGHALLDGLATSCVERPDRIAVTDLRSSSQHAFSDIQHAAESARTHLHQLGVRPGDNVVVTLPLSVELIAYCYGVFLVGAVPAFLDPNQPPDTLAACLADLDAPVWVSELPCPGTDLYDGIVCTPTSTGFDSARLGTVLPDPSRSEMQWDIADTVLLLYTSGTTGIPKGVPWTSRELASQMRYYRSDEISSEFCLFPHLALVAVAMGRRVVLPDLATVQPARLDVAAFYQQLAVSGSDYLFASPLVWHRLITHMDQHHLPAPALRRVATAGSAIGARLVERMQDRLAPAEVVVPYASTEVLMPITLIGADEHVYRSKLGTWTGMGTPLGRPPADMDVAVVESQFEGPHFDVALDGLPADRTGEIVVSGARVSTTYFHRDDAVRTAKLRDTRTGEIWHRTGDFGYIDSSGLVWYLCRRKDVVDSPHGPIHPDALEQMWNMVTGFLLSAVVYLEDLDRLFYVFPHDEDPRAVDLGTMAILAQRLHLPRPTPVHLSTALPTDPRHNSKIDRGRLRRVVEHLVATEGL